MRSRSGRDAVPVPEGSLFPVTIISTRYRGTYEGGTWAAFPFEACEVPEDATGEDVECADWWGDPPLAVGVGDSPDGALLALMDAVRSCPHPEGKQGRVPAGWHCRRCNQFH